MGFFAFNMMENPPKIYVHLTWCLYRNQYITWGIKSKKKMYFAPISCGTCKKTGGML